jgi:D-threo-aldose 1-dehydrogenase
VTVTASRLGYGCTRLTGPRSPADARRLLDEAFAGGVTHFDVARAYGSGDAERILGGFATGRRDQITITSKFGITPYAIAGRSGASKRLARRLMRASPRVRRALSRQSARMASRRVFEPDAARRSLETSLAALGTDHLDVLLLHDCQPDDCTPELLGFLRESRDRGAIRAFGIGTDAAAAARIADVAPGFCDVVQVPAGVTTFAERPPLAGARAVIGHGPFDELGRLRTALGADAAFRGAVESLGVRADDDAALAALLLKCAVHRHPRGPVLFSSGSPAHVAANVRAVSDPDLAAVAEAFLAVAREHRWPA